MYIRTNVRSMDACRLLRRNQTGLTKSLEKLSSGLKINRSADDNSGLAISENIKALITGLDAASENSGDGAALAQTGDGTMQEIHNLLNRMVELTEKSANGVYNDLIDREALQREFSQLKDEIDRIIKSANFNNIRLFRDTPETAVNRASLPAPATFSAANASAEFSVFYAQEADEASAMQATIADPNEIRRLLKSEIVPHAIQSILAAYPAFYSLEKSKIGIGLRLLAESNSRLASVSSTLSKAEDGAIERTYQLTVNLNNVGDLSDEAARSSLESTIAHEMVHALMDEAVTGGMFGKDQSGNDAQRFPDWFIEGMAQTASGPGGWVSSSGGLGISSSDPLEEISAKLSGEHALSAGNMASQYGTGYLACMYLGYRASGSAAMNAQSISSGLSRILGSMMEGRSLDQTLSELTGYSGVSDFETSFAADASSFVSELLTVTGDGFGSVLNGDLTSTDLLANGTLENIHLFELDAEHETVQTISPMEYDEASSRTTTQKTGGGLQISTEHADGIRISDGALEITKAGSYTISGSAASDQIRIADGVKGVVLNLDNASVRRTDSPAVVLGKNAEAALFLTGSNELQGGRDSAGIQLQDHATLTVTGSGSLRAQGGISGSGNGTTVSLEGGAVTASEAGKPAQIYAETVRISGGSVAGSVSSATLDGTTPVYSFTRADWTDVTAVTQNGNTTSLPPQDSGVSLWLTGEDQTVSITRADGSTENISLAFDAASGSFSVVPNYPASLFQVSSVDAPNGASFDPDTGVLTIQKAGRYTISGGAENGKSGRISVAGNLGNVSLTLRNVTLDQSQSGESTGGVGAAAIEIGERTNVSLTLAPGSANSLQGGAGKAGLQVGEGANLTINGNGSLTAVGGYGAAGIGSGLEAKAGKITILSGTIAAQGGEGAAGIGSGANAGEKAVGAISIKGGDITAEGAAHGAGIGSGQSSGNGEIQISGGNVRASSPEHGAGVGSGCQGSSGPIVFSGGTVNASGGEGGAGVGAGWHGACGDIRIQDGVLHAQGGAQGAGIGAGAYARHGSIQIEDGLVSASTETDGVGIGGGLQAVSGPIALSGGDITVAGSPNGLAVSSYEDVYHFEPIPIVLEANASVQAGEGGDGTVSTSGVTDASGTPLTPYPLAFDSLLDGNTLTGVTSRSETGTVQSWTPDAISANEAHPGTLWMTNENQTVTVSMEAADGTQQTAAVDLVFSAEAGLFRAPDEPVAAAAAAVPVNLSDPADPSGLLAIAQAREAQGDGILIQAGAEEGDTVFIPRFYLSLESLHLDDADISTQTNAWKAMPHIRDAINTVSRMRSQYGAAQRELEHNVSNLNITSENLSAANSRIRDVDMAKEMLKNTTQSILIQTTQSMLAQANQVPSTILSLLQ